jgi:LmbE family N-acetylglucosaminyl deacetylase
MTNLKLMAILAHPDDESLGMGGTLAKYAAEGVETSLLTATSGQGGRYHGHRPGTPEHPGREALGQLRRTELANAARTLGLREVTILDYQDGSLDGADVPSAVDAIARHIRRVRPQVVLTFPPDGAYGHPDHIAISQLAQAAVVTAGDVHAVSKLYYVAWPQAQWDAYQEAFHQLVSTVDGVERRATPWPDWAISTRIDTRAHWQSVWKAISCHASQVAAYEGLKNLSPAGHEAMWGQQSFYRAFSLVNGGRTCETDLFEGLR